MGVFRKESPRRRRIPKKPKLKQYYCLRALVVVTPFEVHDMRWMNGAGVVVIVRDVLGPAARRAKIRSWREVTQ